MDDAANLDALVVDAERLLSETEQEVKEVKEEVHEEEPVVVEPEPEAPIEEEEVIPHGERSRLGRKMKRLEDTISEIKSSLDFLKERTISTHVATPQEEFPELPENPTAEEIKEYMDKREARVVKTIQQQTAEQAQKADKAKKEYAQEYARLMKDTLDLDFDDSGKLIVPEDAKDVYALLADEKDITYNQVYKGDPKEDFLINYRNATRAVATKNRPTKPAPTRGVKPGSVNVPNTSTPAPKFVDRSKLSPEEQAVAKMFSDEELAEMGI